MRLSEPEKVEAGFGRLGAVGLRVRRRRNEAPDAAPFDAGMGSGACRTRSAKAVYSADDERMQTRCSAADFTVTQRIGKAAAKGCAVDFAIALGRGRADFDAEAGRRCVEMLH